MENFLIQRWIGFTCIHYFCQHNTNFRDKYGILSEKHIVVE